MKLLLKYASAASFVTFLASFGPSPACARRRRALAPLACNILRARSEGREFAPTAWAAGIGGVWLAFQAADVGWFLLPSLALFAALCLIALFDVRYFIIPDGPIYFLFACGLATTLMSAPGETATRLAAATAGYAALRFVAYAYQTLRGAPGVGQGDAKLFAVAGLWLGFSGLPSSLVYAVLSALVSAAIAIRQGSLDHARQPLPFGPHLALSLWLVWSFGPLEIG